MIRGAVRSFECRETMKQAARTPRDPSAPVACLGLSPAFQRTLVLDGLHAGEVNRAQAALLSAGGKAVNAAVALARLRRHCIVAGFNGGDTGQFVASYLSARGVSSAFTRTPWATRTCTTLLDRASGNVTELVEEAQRPPAELFRRFVARGQALLRQASFGVLCGTLPAGVPEDLWLRFAAAARRSGVPLLIDSHAGPLLRALREEPLMARLNAQELAKTFGKTCHSEAQVMDAAGRLTSAGAAWALVTRGSQPAILRSRAGEAWRITPPQVRAVSAIGSGDCVNAGLAHALLQGKPMPEAVRFGLGCGSAQALTCTPADFVPATARKLGSACRVERMELR